MKESRLSLSWCLGGELGAGVGAAVGLLVAGVRGGSRPVYKVCTNLSEFFPKIFL